jgi:hypothetical protein
MLWKTELEGLVRLVSSLGGPEYTPGDYGDYLQVFVLSTKSDLFFVTTRLYAAMYVIHKQECSFDFDSFHSGTKVKGR